MFIQGRRFMPLADGEIERETDKQNERLFDDIQ